MTVLGQLSRHRAANELLRLHLRAPGATLEEKKAVIILLSSDLEILDNETFVQEIAREKARALVPGDSPAKHEAAALLIALKGPAAVKQYDIPESLVLDVLTGRDRWAEAPGS